MGESCWNRSEKSSQKVKEGRRFIDKPVRSSTKQIVEFNISARSGNIKPTFKNIPLSNIDLQNWCHYLNIKIKGILAEINICRINIAHVLSFLMIIKIQELIGYHVQHHMKIIKIYSILIHSVCIIQRNMTKEPKRLVGK